MTAPILDLETQQARARAFRELHEPGPLVLANAWDSGSAHLIAGAGARAIATTSGGQSWAQGLPDGHHLPVEDVLANVRRIAATVDLPVSTDIEGGYADSAADLRASVARFLAAGAVGVNVEDSGAPDATLYTPKRQAERIAAVRASADEYGVDLFINARTDVFLFAVGEESGRLDDVLARADAYRQAGADGIFAPGLLDPDALRRLADETGLKVNAMWLPGAPGPAELAKAGVARFSAGTAIAQVAYTTAQNAARALIDQGDDAALASSIDYFSMNAEFTP